jgi:hypothetical protein
MSSTKQAPLSEQPPFTTRLFATDVDAQTALALARAATRALIALSPDARCEIAGALQEEIDMQEAQEGLVPRLVASFLEGHRREAA